MNVTFGSVIEYVYDANKNYSNINNVYEILLHLNENYVRKGIFKNMPTVKRERSTSRASSRKSSPKRKI